MEDPYGLDHVCRVRDLCGVALAHLDAGWRTIVYDTDLAQHSIS